MRHFKFTPMTLLNSTRAEWSELFQSHIDKDGVLNIRIRLPTRATLRNLSKAQFTWIPPWDPLASPLSYYGKPKLADRLSYWGFCIAPGHLRVAGFDLVWDEDPRDILKPPVVPDLNIPRPTPTMAVETLTVEPADGAVRLITDRGELLVDVGRWDRFLTNAATGKGLHPEGHTWLGELKVPNRLISNLL